MKGIKIAVVVGVLLLAGCATETSGEASTFDCDIEDQAAYSVDCGYWEGDTFVWWYWLTLGQVVHAPAGFSTKVPNGASTIRPPGATGRPKVLNQPKPPNAPAPPKAQPVKPYNPPKPPPPKFK